MNDEPESRSPILRQHTWCMTCLRVSVPKWTDTDSVSLQPFVVRCFAETYDGKNCQHCNKLHKPCETVSVRDCPGEDSVMNRADLA